MKNILITLLCLIVGPILAWRGLSDLITASRAKSWPTAQGIVQSSELSSTSRGRGGTRYAPFIKYVYGVNGTKYLGQRIDYGDQDGGSREDAMAAVTRYAKG